MARLRKDTTTELPEGVVIDDDGVAVEEVTGKPLSDGPDYVPEPVEAPVSVFETEKETVAEEVNKPLNKKIRDKIDELTGRGVSVVYPTNESNWDNALFDRLNKL